MSTHVAARTKDDIYSNFSQLLKKGLQNREMSTRVTACTKQHWLAEKRPSNRRNEYLANNPYKMTFIVNRIMKLLFEYTAYNSRYISLLHVPDLKKVHFVRQITLGLNHSCAHVFWIGQKWTFESWKINCIVACVASLIGPCKKNFYAIYFSKLKSPFRPIHKTWAHSVQ